MSALTVWDVPRLAKNSDDPFWCEQADYLFAEFGHRWGPDEEAITIAEIFLAEHAPDAERAERP